MIDLYCERLGPGFWAEPFNALTNLSYIVAAFAIGLLARRCHGVTSDAGILIVLMMVIGIGSALFHTFAETWARYLDELPILFFQLTFLWVYGRKVIHLEVRQVTLWLILFSGSVLFARQFPLILNGSLTYIPTLFFLVMFSLYHFRKAPHEPYILVLASGFFSLSLLFRSIDLDVCDHFPIGTHFLWHLSSALVLYLVCRGYLLNRKWIKN